MNRSIRTLLLLAALLAAGRVPAAAQTTLIRDVRLFDGDRVSGPTSVLVRAGVIETVGAVAAPPADAEVLDGRGMTLLPGLIDAHTHAFGDALQEAVVFGVTTELDMFTEPGTAAALRAEQRRPGGAPDRADLFSAGVLATPPGGHGTEYGLPIPTIRTADSAQAWVDARLAEGSDYIKIVYDDGALFGLDWPTLDRRTLGALVEASHRRDRLAVVHVSTATQAVAAVEAGADGLVHLFTDSLASPAFIDAARDRGVFVVPTLVVLKSITGTGGAAPLLEDSQLRPYLNAASRANLVQAFPARGDAAERFAVPLRTVALLRAAGVPVLAGTDAPNPGTSHGAALHRELELLVEAGLSPLEALHAATGAPADAFGLRDRGRIRAGLRADLVLVRGDPTRDIRATRAIVAVWKGGVRVDRAAFARRVAETLQVGPPAVLAESGLIDDFEDTAPRFGTAWMPNTDAFIGGTSTATVELVPAGAGGQALRVEGTIAEGAATPWAGVMWSPGSQPMQPADLSGRAGLRFRTRGDGRTHRVLVFAQGHGRAPLTHQFTAPSDWTEVEVPWAALGIDGSDVMAVMFVGGPAAGAFRFELDDIELSAPGRS